MKIAAASFLAVAMLATGTSVAADTLISERQISTDAALEMAQVALAACRKHGSIVTITILDRADRVVVSVRDNGASPHSVEHSLRKAHTALTYNMSSREYGKNAAGNPGSIGALHLANITTAAGGRRSAPGIRWWVPSASPARPASKAAVLPTRNAQKPASRKSPAA